MKIAAAVLAVVLMSGCAAHVNHPGSANTFDSDTYDTLLVTNATITQTKVELTQGAFSADQVPLVKTALNTLITAYDEADTVYIVYHTAALAGTATTDQQTAVTAAITKVNSAASALVSVRGAK